MSKPIFTWAFHHEDKPEFNGFSLEETQPPQITDASAVGDIDAWPLSDITDTPTKNLHYAEQVPEPHRSTKAAGWEAFTQPISAGVFLAKITFPFIFTRRSQHRAVPTAPQGALSLGPASPALPTSPFTDFVDCEKQMFPERAALPEPKKDRGREGKQGEEISFKQIFLPAPLTLQSLGVSYRPR